MKRRILLATLTLVTLFACAFGFSACDEEHTHSYTSEVTTAATCTTAGVTTYTCSCGDSYTEAIPAAGHTPAEAVKENEKAATCTEDGSYESVIYCSVCKNEISRETVTVAAKGHTSVSANNGVAATCTRAGKESDTLCSVCGETLSTGTTIPALAHTPSEAVKENEKAASCTTDGSYESVIYCTVCGAEISRETKTIEATGHTEVSADNAVVATCTSAGKESDTVCSVCGETLSTGTTISILAHTPAEVVKENAVAATCTEDGSYDSVVYCSVCGAEICREKVTIEATGHTSVSANNAVAATCTSAGKESDTVCSICGETLSTGAEIPATGYLHTLDYYDAQAANFTKNGNIAYWYCSSCGKYFSDEYATNEISADSIIIPAYGNDVSASTDYSQSDGNVSYRYSYSISVADGRFVLYVLKIGNDESYSLECKTGDIIYNPQYDIYQLNYDDGTETEYIKFTFLGFYFCTATGEKISNKTEIEKGGDGETVVEIAARAGNSTYGYYNLAYESNGYDMQRLYYQMYMICEAFLENHEDIAYSSNGYVISNIDLNDYTLSADEAVSVWKVFYVENPLYYWLSNSVAISGGILKFCIDGDYALYSARQGYNNAIDSMIAECTEMIDSDMSELEKAFTVHDYILNKIDYAYQSDGATPETAIWAHNIIGVAAKNYGVCESYAKTYMMLCLLNGLNCIVVTGYANGESHAWNLVQIDSVWYGVDCTWDETNSTEISYACFGMSESGLINTYHAADTSYFYGVNYLYDLPAVSARNIQLVTLYKDSKRMGLYVNIDAALEAMTVSSSEYTIELFIYEYTGALLLSSPSVKHEIYSSVTPTVSKITIIGNKKDWGGEWFSTLPVYVESELLLQCDLELYNIVLGAYVGIDLGVYTLITTGYYCRLDGTIYDNKTNDTISIDVYTTYETEIRAELQINFIKHSTNSGCVYLRSNSNVKIYMGHNLQIYDDDVALGGSHGFDISVIIERFILPADALFYSIELHYSSVTIGVIEYEYEDETANDETVRLCLTFDEIDQMPNLTLLSVKANVNLVLSGSITHSITDISGNEVDRYTKSVNPFLLNQPIATLGEASDFNKISIIFIMWWNGSGMYEDYTDCYNINAQNQIVLSGIDVIDNDFYVKDGILLSYTGNGTSVVIPNGITAIGDCAFYGNESIVSIVIPDSVTSIGNRAFEYCTSLTNVTIGNGVTSIGSSAFQSCTSLTSIVIPDSVTSIGNSAFSSCTSLTSIVIPDSVTSIGSSAFYECTSLTSVTIGSGVTSIGYQAFAYCTSLTSVTIGSGVTSIGYQAFAYCTSLTSIVIPDSVTSIGNFAFEYCTSLTSIVIPDSVTSIGSYAFEYCTSLTSVTIGNGVIEIGSSAFYGCSSLTNITIPDGVTYIGSGAFEYCTSLTSIMIPDSVTSIGSYAFYNCTALTEINYNATKCAGLSDYNGVFYKAGQSSDGITVTIGANVTKIPAYLFCPYYNDSSYSPKIVSVVFAENSQCTSIGSRAFSGCTSLTRIVIPDGVTSIGSFAFQGCTSLTSITVDKNNSYYKSIDGNLYSKDGTTLIQYAIGKTDASFTIPDGVTSIGEWAFSRCKSLESITIPDGVTSIGDYAFYGCTSLTSVTIGNGVTEIGEWAFSSCTSLKFNKYDNAYYLGNESNPYVVLVEAKSKDITSCTINEKTKFIHSDAFEDCSSLTSIVIPDSVTSIGYWAFWGCTSLTSIVIPDSVTSIGAAAFSGCTSLTSVTILDGVTSIEEYAFESCRSLTSIVIPDSVTSIGSWAFYECTSLESVTIGNGVTSISEETFYGCSSLTSVTFQNTSGWWRSSSSTATSGTSISSTDLADPATAATYLTSTYCSYYWKRS